ncbi:calcium-binding protein [Leptolyngbya ohadii]|uniref:calcium-binding protein n=1 Tax=Leptolyngbya ohadii TaxID=1962290 RepID=UPI000B59DAE7|nr:hypothetical protein [Leptolyngbya ohadii]
MNSTKKINIRSALTRSRETASGATTYQITGQFASTTPGANNGGTVSGSFDFDPAQYDALRYSLASPLRLTNWNITTTPDGSLVSGNNYVPGFNSSGTVALNESRQWFFRFAFGSGNANIRLQFTTPAGVAGSFPQVSGSELKGITAPLRSRQLVSINIALTAPSPTPPIDLILKGSNQGDVLTGGTGNDTLSGFEGNDALSGLDGNDILIGGAGNDRLTGGTGNDRLTGSIGNDTITGNEGRDRFVLTRGLGQDRILDFQDRQDRLELPRGIRSIDIDQRGQNLFVRDQRDVLAVLVGIRMNQVSAADFRFT